MGCARTTEADRLRGLALGAALKRARGSLSQQRLSSLAEVDLDKLRRVEQGRVASPGFFFVGSVAQVLNVPLDEIFGEAVSPGSRSSSD